MLRVRISLPLPIRKDVIPMFRKYEKTFRLGIPEFKDVKGKFYLDRKEIKQLLASNVSIEEKMDGANTGIIRHKTGFHLQKRGSLVGRSEHAQFDFFYNWAYSQKYDNIMSIPVGYLVYGELMFACHHIFYDRLPDYFLVFDVYNTKKNKWMNRRQKEEFCSEYGFSIVPLIDQGVFTLDELYSIIPKESRYGHRAEGVVVKRYNKKNYIRGKIVWPSFMKEIDDSDHWRNKPVRMNLLKS